MVDLACTVDHTKCSITGGGFVSFLVLEYGLRILLQPQRIRDSVLVLSEHKHNVRVVGWDKRLSSMTSAFGDNLNVVSPPPSDGEGGAIDYQILCPF